MVSYEVITPLCWRSVVQVPVVRVDIGGVIYKAMTPPIWDICGSSPACQSGYRSGEL